MNSLYLGSYSFIPENAKYFCSRDKFVKNWLKDVKVKNLIPILGTSKSGKSSVVLAELVPKLAKAKNCLFAYFSPGKNPFYAIAKALFILYIPEINEKK
ncbi:hypothetical protein [Okeania sp. KiyG1]|uniref:nSTAND1 domain-containing NTPase n=1 Tax=Okeania sp. KiyG1 TaxID=2720165 RepID=UPI0035C90D42